MEKYSKKIEGIRALVIEETHEGKRNGNIIVNYDKEEFEEILENTDKKYVTKVYEMKEKDRKYIIEEMYSIVAIKDDNKIKEKLNDSEMFMKVLVSTTDIPYKMTVKSDRKRLEELMENPTMLFGKIQEVVYKGIKDVFVQSLNTLAESANNGEFMDKLLEVDEKQKDIENLQTLEEMLIETKIDNLLDGE